jgi:hypothetical protein
VTTRLEHNLIVLDVDVVQCKYAVQVSIQQSILSSVAIIERTRRSDTLCDDSTMLMYTLALVILQGAALY